MHLDARPLAHQRFYIFFMKKTSRDTQDLDHSIISLPQAIKHQHLQIAHLDAQISHRRVSLHKKQAQMLQLLSSNSKKKHQNIDRLWEEISNLQAEMKQRQMTKISKAEQLLKTVDEPLQVLNKRLHGLKEEEEQQPRPKTKKEQKKTYCYCNGMAFGEMVCCDNLFCVKEWFHLECIGQKTAPKGSWLCNSCRSLKK